MKARKIIAIRVATIVILEIVVSRFIRLLNGKRALDLFERVGGLKDISLMGLINIAFVALFSFFKRVHLQSCASCSVLNGSLKNRSIVEKE